jgi:hypothetical protein
VGSAGSGSPIRLPRLRSFLSVQLGLDLGVRDGHKALHKIRELAKIALNILRGIDGAGWLLRHVEPSGMRVFLRASKVNSVGSSCAPRWLIHGETARRFS